MKRVLLIIVVAIVVTSCYKSKLSNTTHPDKGKVSVNIDMPTDAPQVADGYTIIFDGESYTATDTSITLDAIVEPGEYLLYIYSNSSEISIEEDINELGEGTITLSKAVDSDNVVESLTEDIYFGVQTITILADQVISSQVNLSQVTRDIFFNFEITDGDPDNILLIESNLSGIAQQWECVEDLPIGDAANINPAITQGASLVRSTEDNDYLTGSIKVLGVQGDSQELQIQLTFTDGTTQDISIDVSEQLAGSNDTKSTPITLSNNIDTPIEGSTEGEIGDWTEGAGDSQTVN